MFYFGESEFEKSDYKKVTNEIKYKPFLLQHMIVGLQALQHKGNMVLKLYEAETSFTVGLLFILYCLFETVLVFKPFTTSPMSSGQYVVCKNLRNLEAVGKIVHHLNKVYESMLSNKDQDLQSLIDFSIIENEDALKQSLNKLNDANHTARSDLMKVAFASI
jgi:hypothetical protein